MAADDTQKILESLHHLEQRLEKGFSQAQGDIANVRGGLTKVIEEMQGGFTLTHERIAQSEQNIKHILETVIDLHDSLDNRVEKLESELSTSQSH